jgi:hypothetical protein
MLQCSNEVVVVIIVLVSGEDVDMERQCRPDAQQLPYRRFRCAEDFQIETEWRSKNHISPTSAYVYQLVPIMYISKNIYGVIDLIEIKYFQEDIVWE